jgi:hypothetical protein
MKRKDKVDLVSSVIRNLWVGQLPSAAETHYMASTIVDELKKAKNK